MQTFKYPSPPIEPIPTTTQETSIFEVSVQDLTDSESAEFAWEDVALGGFDLVRAI